MPSDVDFDWFPPLPPGFAGPQDLTNVVVSYWTWANRFQKDSVNALRTHISERGLTRLLELAYQASLEQDEGRNTRIRLFVSSEQNTPGKPRLLCIFPNHDHADG